MRQSPLRGSDRGCNGRVHVQQQPSTSPISRSARGADAPLHLNPQQPRPDPSHDPRAAAHTAPPARSELQAPPITRHAPTPDSTTAGTGRLSGVATHSPCLQPSGARPHTTPAATPHRQDTHHTRLLQGHTIETKTSSGDVTGGGGGDGGRSPALAASAGSAHRWLGRVSQTTAATLPDTLSGSQSVGGVDGSTRVAPAATSGLAPPRASHPPSPPSSVRNSAAAATPQPASPAGSWGAAVVRTDSGGDRGSHGVAPGVGAAEGAADMPALQVTGARAQPGTSSHTETIPGAGSGSGAGTNTRGLADSSTGVEGGGREREDGGQAAAAVRCRQGFASSRGGQDCLQQGRAEGALRQKAHVGSAMALMQGQLSLFRTAISSSNVELFEQLLQSFPASEWRLCPVAAGEVIDAA
ncbi:MAG: hypothetical protein WDW36_003433 [Sanguina aurantia]